MKGGKIMHRKKHNVTRKRKVHFNLKKNQTHTIPKIKKRAGLRKTRRQQRGGNLLPQTLTNIMRGSENAVVNTLNTLKGTSLNPSPYPTQDQPIDQLDSI
jgi:hypothetical protein